MPNKPKAEIEDEPGAEDRFMSGVRKALATPPKPFTPPKAHKDEAKKESGGAAQRKAGKR